MWLFLSGRVLRAKLGEEKCNKVQYILHTTTETTAATATTNASSINSNVNSENHLFQAMVCVRARGIFSQPQSRRAIEACNQARCPSTVYVLYGDADGSYDGSGDLLAHK